ncbi:MAG: hypothetical protein K6T85_02250 [Gorillibacterium sp.]|nr:hypothetical protein [Gorillibacterium sp.]
MRKCDCSGDEQNCELEVDLPDDYIDTLYEQYVKETPKPLSKEQWIKTITA